MAILHVDNAGSNTSPYDTWAKAATNLSTAAGAAAAGDTIYVASTHSESVAGQTITFTNGTAAAPIIVLCGVKDTTSGITSLAVTGTVDSTTSTFTLAGFVYAYGVIFRSVTGGISNSMRTANTHGSVATYEQCEFHQRSTSSSSQIRTSVGTTGEESRTRFINCRFTFGNASQSITVIGYVEIKGGGIISGSTSLTTFANMNSDDRPSRLLIDGFDFSNFGTGFDVFGSTTRPGGHARAVNCKMPSGWTGEVDNATTRVCGLYELINYGAGDTNYKFWTRDSTGDCKDETTIKRTSGGASDEVTAYSMRMTTSATAAHPGAFLRSPPIIQRLTTTGSQRTVTVEIVHDGASAMTDKEIWLEVQYLGTSGFPLSLFANDRASLISSAAAQDSSSEAWDGDTGTGPNGSGTWNTLKLVATITAEEVGYVIGTVCVAKPSWTVFVDPKMAIASVA